MIDALTATLPIAIGIILSPLPVVAVILLIFSPHSRAGSLAFLAGWTLGITVVGGATLLLATEAEVGEEGAPARWALSLTLILGLALLAYAYRTFAKRPRAGEAPQLPSWMQAFDSMAPRRAFTLAAALSGVKPKNLLLNISAMTSLALAGLPTAQTLGVFVAFVVLCSAGIGVPVIYALVGGQSARSRLGGWKEWLVTNNSVVVTVVLVVLGLKLVASALSGLA
jgi:hypothetical protein